jgi:hypothetical protein
VYGLRAESGTGVRLKGAPFLVLAKQQMQAIIDRHGIRVGVDEAHRLESMGILHSIYALGTELVLRVSTPRLVASVRLRRTRGNRLVRSYVSGTDC